MQTEQIVALLIAERDRLNRAIEALEGTPAPARVRAKGPAKRAVKAASPAPGPAEPVPAASVKVAKATPVVRKRKPRTAAQRKEQSARMKAFWAARRKQKAK